MVAKIFKHLTAVLTALVMYGNAVSARRDKSVNISYGLDYHKVNVEEKMALRTQRGNEIGAEADVWYKHSVHYVKVKIVSPALLNLFYLFAKAIEVSGKQ
jgi:hypothetical protein